jgi:iron complex outermembrane receptor protein
MRVCLALAAGFAIAALSAIALSLPAAAQQTAPHTEQVVVYGTLADSDIGISPNKVPSSLQSISAERITVQHGPTVLDALGGQFAGTSIGDTQGNTMFQDVRYRGFEASPLQGRSEGLAVYENGVRLNEAFGDTVNWDAIPETAISRMDLWSNNPVFGLNALGGAINVIMKDGFSWQGHNISLQGGSYSHGMGTLQYGVQDRNFSFYAAGEGITDGGWRDQSSSSIGRLYADAGWRRGRVEVHLVASGSMSLLGVVGPTPVELIQRDKRSVYTSPQTTHNRIGSLALNAKGRLRKHWLVEASFYGRTLRQRHVDGNNGNFENCPTNSSFGGDICLQDDPFGTPAGGRTTAYQDQFVLMNPARAVFAFDPSAFYGTIDRTFTDTTTFGATIQTTEDRPLLGLSNFLTMGGSIDRSAIAFRSTSTLGAVSSKLNVAPDPSLTGSGNVLHTFGSVGYAPVNLAATTDYYGIYVVDALDLTKSLTATGGFRFNIADLITRDRSASAAELNGTHRYSHFNPLLGLTYKMAKSVTLFGAYSEANRAPTPLEIDCASPTQPCLLEGSLVADPPLQQVVSHTYETGFRGSLGNADSGISWSASLFRTDSKNDIVSLASVIQGRGYFANVPLTRRQGLDVSARYSGKKWSAFVNYSYLDATYQFTGTLASPNNPSADANGNITVIPGRHIPLNPAIQVRVGGDADVFHGLSVGAEFAFSGSQFYAGDQANLNPKLPSNWVVNMRAAYRIKKGLELFGLVNNLFNRRDATYGTFFQPTDTVGLVSTALTDSRSLTIRQPISFQLGLRVAY